MKKTLAALAVMSAFAATSAFAADVTLYGVVDLGLKYSHVDSDKPGVDATDKFEMKSGGQSGSRFGLKGVEDLGNGMAVGFVLENGFNADDGTLGNNDRLFGREANLFIRGAFGELSFGRVGQLTSGNGSYGITGNLSPFGTSWGGSVEGSTFMVGYSRMDNTVTYKTPTFAGFTAYAQYSFEMNTKGVGTDDKHYGTEGKSSADRYYALGATYKNGGLNLVGVVDSYNWSTYQDARDDVDDGITFTLGGSYDFGVAKAYLGAQYYDNMYAAQDFDDDGDTFASIGTGISGQFEGYSVMTGVDAPVFGGKAMFALGYADTEAAETAAGEEKAESTRWGVSAGYTYPFSKRTNVYAVAAYYQDKIENEAGKKGSDRDPSSSALFLGLRHTF